MCLILLAIDAHPKYPLIIAANRDEAYSRPAAHASFWEDHPRVYAGRDLEKGGTWLGMTRNVRFAATTNYRQGTRSADAKHSRGELTRDYLTGVDTPEDYLRRVEAQAEDYNGFSLIVGDGDAYWFYSNRGGVAQKITPGVHGLSNHLLDEPWPKVRKGTGILASLLHTGESELVARLFALLADRTPAPDDLLPATGVPVERERRRSASFIADETYGTRASTVLLVGTDAHALFCERNFGPQGSPSGESAHRFELDYEVRRSSAARARI